MIRNHTAKIFKRSVTVSDYGTEVVGWVNCGNVTGFLDIFSISKGEIAGKIVEDTTHIFITTEIEDIKHGDRLKFKDMTYEVNFVSNPMMINHHLEIELKVILEQDTQSELLIYFGVIDEDVNLDVSDLQSEIIKTKAFIKTIDVNDGDLYIIYPKSLGKSSIRLRSKLITNWNINEMMINGVSHYCYSVSVDSGEMKIELF